MNNFFRTLLFLALMSFGHAEEPNAVTKLVPTNLPVRALMLYGLPPSGLENFLDFVRHDLPREGVNHLIFQIDYGYEYQTHPELVAKNAYTRAQIKSLVAACHEAGIKLIPLVNCLGHQSWAQQTHQLLTVYPEFDETAGLYPQNKGLYCRSYCPNHPDVHRVIFDLLGEITDVFETDAVHVGMDEVFLIGEATCPRCHGKNKAELFAQEVRTLRDFLATKKARLWMWGDRFIDGDVTGLGEWEGSKNQTSPALDLVPKDIVICDWHYDSAPPTPGYFAVKGFEVVVCSYNKPVMAVAQAEQIFKLRQANPDNHLGPRLLGVMSTNWGKSEEFASSVRRAKSSGALGEKGPAANFIRLFEKVRLLNAETEPSPKPTAP
jgi:Glycosyl hydrolase family 20, catalytic domain